MPSFDKDPAGLKQSELRSIVIMIAAALALFVILLGLLTSAGSIGKNPEGKGAGKEEDARKPAIFDQTGNVIFEPVDDPGDPYEKTELPPSKAHPWVEDQYWNEDVVDDDEAIEDRAFYYLIHKAALATDEDIKKSVDSSVGTLDFFARPDAIRGRAVTVRGDLLQIAKKEFPENRSGMREAYFGTIVDNHSKPISFYVFSIPPGIDRKDVIEIHGYFFKVWKYENRSKVMISSPMIVARTFKQIPKYPKQAPIRFFGVPLVLGDRNVTMGEIVVLVLLIVLVPGFFVMYWTEKRRFEKYRLEQVEKRKAKALEEKAAASGQAGAPVPAPGSGGPIAPPSETAPSGAQDEGGQPGAAAAPPPDSCPPGPEAPEAEKPEASEPEPPEPAGPGIHGGQASPHEEKGPEEPPK